MSETLSLEWERLRFDDRGLLPVIVQDAVSGAVLMLAWANRVALEATLATEEAHFWSRSRQALWRKGETSGHTLRVVGIALDCDGDTVLLSVLPAGPACHRGTTTCFEPRPTAALELGWLAAVVAERARAADPESSYTARLLTEGLPRVAQKVGEEGVETVIAALDPSPAAPERLASEAADLLFHLLVLLEAKKVPLEAVAQELARRHWGR